MRNTSTLLTLNFKIKIKLNMHMLVKNIDGTASVFESQRKSEHMSALKTLKFLSKKPPRFLNTF